MKVIKILLSLLVGLLAGFVIFSYLGNYNPEPLEEKTVSCSKEAPLLEKERSIKVLSWNIQYMAGKSYVFFYDELDSSGPDERPSSEEIVKTTAEVVRVILDENPDIILLQEVDEGASRTDGEDQTKKLLALLPPQMYPCLAEAFYWKSVFVPHPQIMGSAGMKLLTLSKYKITKAYRHALADIPGNFFFKRFNIKRAVLEVRLPHAGSPEKDFSISNTHFSAFSQGTNTLQLQVEYTIKFLDSLSRKNIHWIIGGDFNMLPPEKKQYNRLEKEGRAYYKQDTQLKPFYEKYQAAPLLEDVNGAEMSKWFTHSPNANTNRLEPDRTIDYIFLSNRIKVNKRRVRSEDTKHISDHLPIITEFEIPQ